VAIGEQSRLLLLADRFRIGAALLVHRSLGLRNPGQLSARHDANDRAPWVRVEYADGEGQSWKELDVPQLLQHPDFLGVAA
jgi:hypothetical protein